MNIRPFTLLNKRGDKKYGYVHAMAPDTFSRVTMCGKRTETALGYWEESEDPVTCPKCLAQPGKAGTP